MNKIYIAFSHKLGYPKEIELDAIFHEETHAEDYVEEMDDCCTEGRMYWVEAWEVQ